MKITYTELTIEPSFDDDPLAQLLDLEARDWADVPLDPRLQGLSPATRTMISAFFNDDVDDAIYSACRLINSRRQIPQWAVELKQHCKKGN